jgi:cation diffusion facilitator family transporter
MSSGRALVRRLALGSIGVAFAVMALKFFAWWLTGSVALYSDALESIVNVVAAFAAFMAIRWAQQPADENHPFGHHKAELLSAVAEGVLIVIAALLIFHQAAVTLLSPHGIDQAAEGMAVNAVASTVNGLWAWLLIRVGRQQRSPALIADGKHVLSDVVSSAGVLFGLVLALATGWLVLDPVLAGIVAINILWQGWQVVNESVQGLMDSALDGEDLARVRSLIEANGSGALEYHDLKSRGAGAARFIEFHLIVPSAMSVTAAHDICDRIEKALKAEMPGMNVVIHVEPEHKRKPDGIRLGSA